MGEIYELGKFKDHESGTHADKVEGLDILLFDIEMWQRVVKETGKMPDEILSATNEYHRQVEQKLPKNIHHILPEEPELFQQYKDTLDGLHDAVTELRDTYYQHM